MAEARRGDDRSLAAVAADVGAVVDPLFAALEELATRVVACRTGARHGHCTERDLVGLEDAIMTGLDEHPAMAGLGYVAAPGSVGEQQRYLLWWYRAGQERARLKLNFDPASVDVYDYLDMEWYRAAERGGPRNAFGPYVDYSGAGQYVITASVPVVDGASFLGVAGADLAMALLEPLLTRTLLSGGAEMVLVNDEPRVIAANTPRWVPAAKLRAPQPGRDGFTEVVAVPGGPGWVLASTGVSTP
ncbi:hypothetical protein [Nocardioides sp.]|uniref:PDC sensor domain-containing protein n=1 Tax=Nocardioides sp. TaxID=35761 RepID=UPI003526C662